MSRTNHREKTKEFRERLGKGETTDDILEEAFAVVREASWRVLELRHYDVQVCPRTIHYDVSIVSVGA